MIPADTIPFVMGIILTIAAAGGIVTIVLRRMQKRTGGR